ncbi:hypothetical protein V1505DRAFT_356051 [Lipomyces doorenjongii]
MLDSPRPFVDDVQRGHTSHVATTYYAIGTDDLASTNRNDVQEFMNVLDRWIRLLGLTTSTSVVDDLTNKATSSEQQQLTTEIHISSIQSCKSAAQEAPVQQTIQVISDGAQSSVPAVSLKTLTLLRTLKGSAARFRSEYQGAAIQAVLSYSGQSLLVILPTGAGKSDVIFLTALAEKANKRVTLVVVPFVALRLDVIRRGQ